MKPKTFLQSLLFLPYVIWVISLIFSAMYQNIPRANPIFSAINFVFFIFSFIYAFGIIFWGIPYTILVIGLLVWSRNKSFQKIYKALFYSPFLLAALTIIGFLVVFLLLPATLATRLPLLEDWVNLVWYSFLATLLNLIFGYFFVGLGIGSYKILKHLKLIKDEVEITPDDLHTTPEIYFEDSSGKSDK